MLVLFPTAIAFAIGRLVTIASGGAYVFAATCSAFLLALAVGAVAFSWIPL